jgi:hypothetical protein
MPWCRLQAITLREQRGYFTDHVALILVVALVGYLITTFAI